MLNPESVILNLIQNPIGTGLFQHFTKLVLNLLQYHGLMRL
jgi:hypothetical protein